MISCALYSLSVGLQTCKIPYINHNTCYTMLHGIDPMLKVIRKGSMSTDRYLMHDRISRTGSRYVLLDLLPFKHN